MKTRHKTGAPVTLEAMMAELPAARRRKVETQARQLIAEEMTLRDLRKARRMTQRRLAAALKIGQDGVSRIEQRSDLLLSTLQNYVSAMGGSLEIVASFPDRPPVVVSGFEETAAPYRVGKSRPLPKVSPTKPKPMR
ncbi:MAG: helix-turn-helix transcriptional regulator [Rhodospirillaceae bacterium]|nr:helix-turn-helix transcriptional regulator [Rhodospirillaceae bacterium]